MSRLHVPSLARKLRMLVTYGYAADMRAVAQALGRAPDTMRGWTGGDMRREPDVVPAAVVPDLLALFQSALEIDGEQHMRVLLQGPPEDLESLFGANAAPSLLKLIEHEADRNAGQLFEIADNALSLIQVHRPNREAAAYELSLGRLFRIEFTTRHRGTFTIGFQSAPGGWGFVPVSASPKDRCLHLPGVEDGAPALMREETDPGHHLFVAVQSTKPFPPVLLAAARDSAGFDRALIAHFLRHYDGLPKSSRALFAIDVEFVHLAATP